VTGVIPTSQPSPAFRFGPSAADCEQLGCAHLITIDAATATTVLSIRLSYVLCISDLLPSCSTAGAYIAQHRPCVPVTYISPLYPYAPAMAYNKGFNPDRLPAHAEPEQVCTSHRTPSPVTDMLPGCANALPVACSAPANQLSAPRLQQGRALASQRPPRLPP
jgi:hypothetical protein